MRLRGWDDAGLSQASTSGRLDVELLLERQVHGRGLQSNLTSSPSFMWAMIAIGATVGVLVLFGIAITVYCCCKKDNKVQPAEQKIPAGQPVQLQQPQVNQDAPYPKAAPFQPQDPGPQPASMPLVPASMQASAPAPVQAGTMPAGIMLAPQVPMSFMPYSSNPRPEGTPPYERLLLISSRIYDPMKVASAALPNVAVVVYDWKNFTLQEIVRYIKRAVGTKKVTSVAVVAPGNAPGSVAVIDGSITTAQKLTEKGELLQFWRVLSGCVEASGTNDGRRVDLIGCRVVEAPREGAALLKELYSRTAVPFAAADDALGGYMLATFLEESTSGSLSLISSTIQGIDLYFNRNVLLGIQPPASGRAPYTPPLPGPINQPGSAPPPTGPTPQYGSAPPIIGPAPEYGNTPPVTGTTPQYGSTQAAGPSYAGAPEAAGRAPEDTVFHRFTDFVASRGYTLPEVFRRYDVDQSGSLSPAQVIAMFKDVMPGASSLDVQHFQAMMDIDGNHLISMEEFTQGLTQNKDVHSQVKSGKDENALMQLLHDYLTDNDAILNEYFQQSDVDGSGMLDHGELSALVQGIPDLTPEEQKFIISYLYQSDKNEDGKMTFEEFKAVIASFGNRQAIVTVAHSVPTAKTAPAPAQPQYQVAPPAPQ